MSIVRKIAAAAGTLLLGSIPIAAQAGAPGWSEGAGISVPGTGHHGVILGPDGTSYLCAADGEAYAASATITRSASMEAPREVDSLEVTSFNGPNQTMRRETLTDSNQLARMAWIASEASTTDPNEAAASQIALVREAGMFPESVYELHESGTAPWKGAEPLAAPLARSKEIVNQAQAEAGPYSVAPAIEQQADGSLAVTGIGVRSASGTWIAGKPYSLSIEGPARISGAEQTSSGTTAGEPSTVILDPQGAGTVKVSLTVENLATSRPSVSSGSSVTTAGDSRAQNLIVMGKHESLTGAASLERMQPKISTKVANARVKPGDSLADVVTVSADSWAHGPDGKPVAVEVAVDVYGPFTAPMQPSKEPTSQDRELMESKLLGTYTMSFAKEGTQESPGTITAPEEGFYFFRARALESSQVAPFDSPYFEEDETTVAPWQPSITTEASKRSADGEEVIHDQVHIEGFPEDHGDFSGSGKWKEDTKEVEHSVYFVPDSQGEPGEGSTKGLEPVAVLTTPARNGDYEISTPIDWTRGKGTYVIVSHFAGDSRAAEVTTSDADTKEHVPVTPPEAPPTLARTGTDSTKMGGFALASVAIGAVALFLKKRAG